MVSLGRSLSALKCFGPLILDCLCLLNLVSVTSFSLYFTVNALGFVVSLLYLKTALFFSAADRCFVCTYALI